MSFKIDFQIPERNFELIRDRVGEILAVEIPNQNDASKVKAVWRERVIPFNKDELPAINVSYAGTRLDNHNSLESTGETEYHIDVHGNSPHGEFKPGDQLSSEEVTRIAGIVWYILSSQEYRTLDFTPPFISHRSISDIQIGRQSVGDASNTVVARVILKVNAQESVSQTLPVTGEIYSTIAKLNNTDKGYLWEVTNP